MNPTRPDALLLIATGCSHCRSLLDGLGHLVKKGAIARLEVVNLSARPEAAESLNIRSVPWTRIGPFELQGGQSQDELADWAELAASGSGWGRYYSHLLETSRLGSVLELIRERPDSLLELVALLGEEDTPMAVRIGVGAVFEELQGSGLLAHGVPELEVLAASELPQVRADAVHYLGLAGSPGATPLLRRMLEDENQEVREIASLQPGSCLFAIQNSGPASGDSGSSAARASLSSSMVSSVATTECPRRCRARTVDAPVIARPWTRTCTASSPGSCSRR